MSLRRVVTGFDKQGRAAFLSDELVATYEPTLIPGAGFDRVWGDDGPPEVGPQARAAEYTSFFPSIPGYRCFINKVPPENASQAQAGYVPAEAIQEINQHLPGLLDAMDHD